MKVSRCNIPTGRQVECLKTIAKLEQRLGRAPSYREVSRAMGLSPAGAQTHLRQLTEKGLLTPPVTTVTRKITAKGREWILLSTRSVTL